MTELVRNLNKPLGTAAQRIYDNCCDSLNWDETKRGRFGPQQKLYSVDATPEGYSVWFIAHSNWTDTGCKNWQNVISGDCNIIRETWKEEYPKGVTGGGLRDDMTTRVTFAKRKGGYVFLGVYKTSRDIEEKILSDGRKVWIKTYNLISETYSETY